MFNSTTKSLIAMSCLVSALTFPVTSLADDNQSTADKANSVCNNAVIKAKILTAYTLNPEVNPFKIDVDVNGDTVTLSGKVANDTEHDLAKLIAQNTDGVSQVTDNISVDKSTQRGTATNFAQKVQDATTTATIKSKLLTNKNTSGLDITVTTINDVVILKGDVKSRAEKALAIQIARSTADVKAVKDELTVKK